MQNDTLCNGLVLDYLTKFKMNASSLEKLTKTQVRFSDNIEGTIERIRALLVLCRLILAGEFSQHWALPS